MKAVIAYQCLLICRTTRFSSSLELYHQLINMKYIAVSAFVLLGETIQSINGCFFVLFIRQRAVKGGPETASIAKIH